MQDLHVAFVPSPCACCLKGDRNKRGLNVFRYRLLKAGRLHSESFTAQIAPSGRQR